MDSPSSASRRRPRWLLHAGWLLLAVLLAVGAWRLIRHPALPVAAGPAGVPATTVQVASETVPIARSGVGTVLPVASVTVRTRVDGQLDSVEFKEGQDIKAGQVLVRIDPRTFQAQLEQLVAQ